MRIEGYAPIRDYAVIGDGRTVALVATDGAIDWLCLPNIDSPSMCAALLDAEWGGAFTVQPSIPFQVSRRYLPRTNVLETTFHTDQGIVRLTDALTLPDDRLCPLRELVRSVEGVSGSVAMRWAFAPRFGYGSGQMVFGWRGGVPVATCGGDAAGICAWNAGQPSWSGGAARAEFTVDGGARAMVVMTYAYEEPLLMPSRDGVERRLHHTIEFWRRWADAREYEGPWREAVIRSALALKLMIFAPSGASSAAATTSLPEEIGGIRNWDYRFCWIRDSSFLINALLQLGCRPEAQALFWWFMQATALTEPELQVLYRLDGGSHVPERSLNLSGYRGSTPVRIGNAAVEQRQLDIYGHLLETAWLYGRGDHRIDRDTGVVLARIADIVCRIWREPDSGIWEVRDSPRHYTHSKVMCWVALDRTLRLAAEGDVPTAHIAQWRREAAAIADFVDTHCWSDHLRSYTRSAGEERTDASLLMLSLMGFGDRRGERMTGTIDAVSRELRQGPYVYRYLADDGLPGAEGCFLNCSFWLADALGRAGRVDEATTLMEQLLAQANDVGLFAEEIHPGTSEFLGNFPQALVHLSLIDAALAISEAAAASRHPGADAAEPIR